MTEHEKLKSICDEIGFTKINKFWNIESKCYLVTTLFGFRRYNVREIIFTPEFMEKFEKQLKIQKLCTDERQNQIDNGDRENYVPDEQIEIQCDYTMFGILYNLHDPVTYLYNLLFNE